MLISLPYLIVPCSTFDSKVYDELDRMDLWVLYKDLKPTFRYVNYVSPLFYRLKKAGLQVSWCEICIFLNLLEITGRP